MSLLIPLAEARVLAIVKPMNSCRHFINQAKSISRLAKKSSTAFYI